MVVATVTKPSRISGARNVVRRGDRERYRPDRRQRRETVEDAVRHAVQHIAQDHEDDGEHGSDAEADHPARQHRAQRPMRRLEPAPLRRQRAIEITADLAQQIVKSLAHAAELGDAALRHAQASFEAQGEAEIHELEHVAVTARLALEMSEEFEEALAAGDVVVEHAAHALARPGRAAAPGRVGDDIVDRGTDGIVGAAQRLARQAGAGDEPLEAANLLDDALAQRLDIGE
jgi:hypothetical protein